MEAVKNPYKTLNWGLLGEGKVPQDLGHPYYKAGYLWGFKKMRDNTPSIMFELTDWFEATGNQGGGGDPPYFLVLVYYAPEIKKGSPPILDVIMIDEDLVDREFKIFAPQEVEEWWYEGDIHPTIPEDERMVEIRAWLEKNGESQKNSKAQEFLEFLISRNLDRIHIESRDVI